MLYMLWGISSSALDVFATQRSIVRCIGNIPSTYTYEL